MKITVYTINDCQFSKQEKEYLNANNLAYEEKNLESNREFLTEMLVVSNNFAGTPVTKIEKDDGTIVVLKGFTKEEFDNALGLKQSSPVPPISTDSTDSKPIAAPLSTPPPPAPTTPSEPAPQSIGAPETPPSQQNEALNSVLDALSQKVEKPIPTKPSQAPPQVKSSNNTTSNSSENQPLSGDPPNLPDLNL